jgi:hypothetical protein
LVEIQGDGYWFMLNPIVDLQVGKSSDGKASYTYVNTRINFRGGLGKELTFSTTVLKVKDVLQIISIAMLSQYDQREEILP